MKKKSIHEAKHIIWNSGWLIAEKIISICSGVFLSVFLVKYLGANDFGKLNFLLSVVILMTPIASLGLNGIVIRELIQKPKQANSIIFTCIIFRLVAGILSLCFIVLLSYSGDWFHSEYRGYLLILGVGHVFSAFQVVDFWFQSKLLSRHVVKIRVITSVLFILMKVLCLVKYNSFQIIITLIAIEVFFQSLILLIPYHLITKNIPKWQFDFSYGKRLVSESYWLILSGFTAILYLKVDQIMIGIFLGDKSVGIYAIASRFSEVWYFIPTAIVASLFPSLLENRKSNYKEYEAKLQNIFAILFWIAVIIALVIQVISEPLIYMLYGEEFQQASSVLVIHIWAGLFIFMRALFSKWLIAERLLYFSLLSQGIGALTNIVLNYYLIPLYGIKGAAITTLISYAVVSWLILFINKKTIPIAIAMTKSFIIPFYLIWTRFKRRKNCQL